MNDHLIAATVARANRAALVRICEPGELANRILNGDVRPGYTEAFRLAVQGNVRDSQNLVRLAATARRRY